MHTLQDRVRGIARVVGALSVLTLLVTTSGCVTVAEFRKLERQVIDIKRQGSGSDSRGDVADLSADSDELRAEIRELRGRIDVVEKTAADALADARRARQQVASTSALAAVDDALPEALSPDQPASAELMSYREAYSSWRNEAADECIDQFRQFLQTYPTSPYADDAAFWMADCHFKQRDYKNAVLRFDDVVRNYPEGNKAPDALFRQGEALLKLGPGFRDAAKKAFERVLKEYPDSNRAAEARRRLDVPG